MSIKAASRVFKLFFIITVLCFSVAATATATAFALALLCIRTADAGLTALFGTVQVPYDTSGDSNNNQSYDNIYKVIHIDLHSAAQGDSNISVRKDLRSAFRCRKSVPVV